jgi:hypothetical protein
MDADRKLWNQGQKALRSAIERSGDHQKAIELFLSQHAMVHSAKMSESGLWSFEDEVLQGMVEEAIRCIPRKCDHSIAWIVWHLARIEDITMNLLVAGSPQILYQGGWLDRIKAPIHHAGNVMDPEAVAGLSAAVNIDALVAYRRAVGRRTLEIARELEPVELEQKVEPSRLQRVSAEGAVVEAASEIIDYWSKRTVAGLLLMPATRHNFLHLNEARRVKDRGS